MPDKDDKDPPPSPEPGSIRRVTQRMNVPASVRAPPSSLRQPPGRASLRRSSPLLRLSPGDFDLVNAARRILEGSLSLVPGEKVLAIVDRERTDLVPPLVEVASLAGSKCEVVILEDVGRRPFHELPKVIDEKLHGVQATILLAGFVDGEHPMRLALLERVRELGLRHAHMIGVTRRTMLAGFSVDPTRILDATRAVRMRLRPSSVLQARTTSGTDLTVRLSPSHRWVEHVGVIRPGRWENLPSGELMTAPLTTSGVYVCDASAGGPFGATAGLLARTPLRLDIQENVVVGFTCTDSTIHRGVEAFLAHDRFSSHVGTIILGTNVGLLAPIGELVCDQNLPGLHLTLGSTFADATGAAPTTTAQLSLTSSGGDVDLDGAPLLRAGRYMV
jgi:aminopeptidase